jgi:hypothetical protein
MILRTVRFYRGTDILFWMMEQPMTLGCVNQASPFKRHVLLWAFPFLFLWL